MRGTYFTLITYGTSIKVKVWSVESVSPLRILESFCVESMRRAHKDILFLLAILCLWVVMTILGPFLFLEEIPIA